MYLCLRVRVRLSVRGREWSGEKMEEDIKKKTMGGKKNMEREE